MRQRRARARGRFDGPGQQLRGPATPTTKQRKVTAVAASTAEDRLAVDVFTRAEHTGQPVTLGLVERRLEELRAHPAGCRCGLCDAAASVRPAGVLRVVLGWSAGIAATRRRAAR